MVESVYLRLKLKQKPTLFEVIQTVIFISMSNESQSTLEILSSKSNK